MNIQLPTGNTISVSVYEFFFILEEKDVDEFYQSCMADNLGVYIDDPFSNKSYYGKLDLEDIPDIEETDIKDVDLNI